MVMLQIAKMVPPGPGQPPDAQGCSLHGIEIPMLSGGGGYGGLPGGTTDNATGSIFPGGTIGPVDSDTLECPSYGMYL